MYIKFKNVNIESFGINLPEKVVTSLDIENELSELYEKLGLVSGRIELMTGIRERRKWEPGTIPSEIASVAGKKALENAQIDADLIGALFNTSVCRDCLEPATANMVHNNLNLSKDCMVLDISNACLGFLNGMIFAAQLIDSGSIKAALITAGENGGPLLDATIKQALSSPEMTRKSFKKMFASFTIGSGGVAAVLTHSDISNVTHRLVGATVRNNTMSSKLCVGGGIGGSDTGVTGGLLMETDSETLLIDGVQLAAETWEEHKKNSELTINKIDHIFCHQVGVMHRKKLYNDLNIPIEKDYSTFEFLGNIGSVSLPLTMSMGIEKRNVKQGDNIMMMGIGSGINCMMLSAIW